MVDPLGTLFGLTPKQLVIVIAGYLGLLVLPTEFLPQLIGLFIWTTLLVRRYVSENYKNGIID